MAIAWHPSRRWYCCVSTGKAADAYDLLDKYFSRQDFELCYMDIDSFYLAMSGDCLDEIVRPEMKQTYEAANENKCRRKGVSKEHDNLNFQPYNDFLDVFLKIRRDSELEGKDIDKAKNVGFRAYDQGMVTYKQNKLGLSAYYDKRYVLADGIRTRPLDF